MEDNLNANHSAAGTYLYQVIKPVVRILIRFGFSARNAADLIRWAYVKVFYETPEFWRDDEPTALQCSLKTGIQRAEITDLLKIDHPQSTVRAERRNRAAHILSAWINDSDFHDNGHPAELPISSPDGKSFRSLVNRYETDARYRSVLDDLIAVGCVERHDKIVRIINTTYGSNAIDTEKLAVAGVISQRHGETVYHNLSAKNDEPRQLHRIWRQRYIPIGKADEIRDELSRIAIDAGRRADQYLASVSHVVPETETEYIESGVVIFTYENLKTEENDIGYFIKEEGAPSWKIDEKIH